MTRIISTLRRADRYEVALFLGLAVWAVSMVLLMAVMS